MSDDQFDKLSQKVDQISEMLVQHGRQISNLNDTVLKLYQHMETRFADIETKIDSKADAERTYALLDVIAKRLETDDQERAALSHQVDRHDTWIHQLAEATHIKLLPER